MADFPPTIFIVHPKERRKKCTVNPLRGKSGFVFRKLPNIGQQPRSHYVRLGFSGPLLSPADANYGLLILDGSWRQTESMEQQFEDVPVRSLPPLGGPFAWKTAYPRVSKLFDDPAGGLATIEALFAAYHILGRNTETLLDDYHWADEFLKLNRERL